MAICGLECTYIHVYAVMEYFVASLQTHPVCIYMQLLLIINSILITYLLYYIRTWKIFKGLIFHGREGFSEYSASLSCCFFSIFKMLYSASLQQNPQILRLKIFNIYSSINTSGMMVCEFALCLDIARFFQIKETPTIA